MKFGLTKNGFIRMRMPVIKTDLESALNTEFGDINLSPDSIFGQLVGVMSKVIADTWETLEDLYHSQYPMSAEGIFLDHASELVGINRLPASKTLLTCLATGDEATLIPAGSLIKVKGTGDLYEAIEDSVISKTRAYRVTIAITDHELNEYSLLINNEKILSSSPTDLLIQLNEQPHLLATLVDQDHFEVVAEKEETPFSISVGEGLSITSRCSPIQYKAQLEGKRTVLPHSAIEIVNPISGLDTIENLREGKVGRSLESDTDFRIRRRQSLRVLGSTSADSIRARILQEVDGVTSVTVIENRLHTTDGMDRPPKSFECIVSGGLDEEIAKKIWEVKPAGIEPTGNRLITLIDSSGFKQLIPFTRPVPILVWLTIDLDVGEAFPPDGTESLEKGILVGMKKYGVGESVMIQRFFSSVYSVPGVKNAVVLMGKSADECVEENLILSVRELADFNPQRMTITT